MIPNAHVGMSRAVKYIEAATGTFLLLALGIWGLFRYALTAQHFNAMEIFLQINLESAI